MLKIEFKELLDLMEGEEHATILGKGEEYTRSQADRLASFKEIASFAGVQPKQVCMIFMAKHWQGLANFVATGKIKSNEDVTGRIMDLRVYLALMRAIIQEERAAKPAAPATVSGGCPHIWTQNPAMPVGQEWCATCGAIKKQGEPVGGVAR